jgi:hypothetical protein
MFKQFFQSSKHEAHDEHQQPNLLVPATPAERNPPPSQVRQSRLGASYEKPAHKKKSAVPKHVETTHKAKLPATNPTRVSRLGNQFEVKAAPPSNSSSYDTVESTDNPVLSFMLSCVTCDDADVAQSKKDSTPVATGEKE